MGVQEEACILEPSSEEQTWNLSSLASKHLIQSSTTTDCMLGLRTYAIAVHHEKAKPFSHFNQRYHAMRKAEVSNQARPIT